MDFSFTTNNLLLLFSKVMMIRVKVKLSAILFSFYGLLTYPANKPHPKIQHPTAKLLFKSAAAAELNS